MSQIQLENLTKKNQEYIHIATSQLIKDGKTDEEIKALLEEILPIIQENQKKGLTARSLFGAPTDWAAAQSESATQDSETKENDNPWLMWLDSSLLMLALVGFVSGALGLFNASNQYGILSLLVLGAGTGAGLYLMYHYLYRKQEGQTNQRPSIWKALIALAASAVVWIFAIFATVFIPTSINPVLPPIGTLIIAAAAFGLRYYLKKRFNIKTAMQATQAN